MHVNSQWHSCIVYGIYYKYSETHWALLIDNTFTKHYELINVPFLIWFSLFLVLSYFIFPFFLLKSLLLIVMLSGGVASNRPADTSSIL